ncbi:UDP-N-acetylmuramoyl-L-alanyl-D-glutamate--2,6-diaminopimelate ligase [Aureibacillus halotolerans]|uniref:UDP-N-acetylmuramoyl-L-alanyl-D-glutamate--2, 6-diaminopimelate ligase n=1 Tax=Aureibacillus halotolerans TaxID=1508390 RepID=UPI001061314F|nr:UDP-N-acetylmuramoyl-L-alanyl-D-glutamate--2,6-diaminopimelate ligase [Aureibacillus halotolerans]
MRLKELADLLMVKKIDGDIDVDITGIQMDSRKIEKGNLFVCVPSMNGLLDDRHQFIDDAVSKGAIATIVERDVGNHPNVTKIHVKSARYAMAIMSAHFYGHPSNALRLYGITGTNGKTTTSYIIETIFASHKLTMGLMGNNGMKINGTFYPTDINTQEPPVLQKNLRQMVNQNVDCCVMEVSSQGLDMARVVGCHFTVGIFTNLTQDHLDYHKTFESYRDAKGLLFSRLGNNSSHKNRQYAVLNADDPVSNHFKNRTAAEVITYGIKESADVSAKEITIGATGISFRLESFKGNIDIELKLIGRFNVYNTLAAITASLIEGIPLERIKSSLATMDNVRGRMELVNAGQNFLVLVDYSHTPDALENVLTTLKEFSKGRIITVFGCGGDRDASKRPKMGRIASALSDHVIITSDNPRSEDPVKIVTEIAAGIDNSSTNYELINNRATAIQAAIQMASKDDIVLIAGKGHENYQILHSETIHFDDREEAIKVLNTLD